MKVELINLTKKFGDLVAVDNVSLTIEDGEFVTLVGPSGCGKTTTLRCIAGLETPTSGTIRIGDKDVTNTSPQNRNVAFVFQDYALYPHMTARKNMSFALEDGDYSREEINERIEDAAEMLEIKDHLDQTPGELSGGQQQRVALGRSIVRNPGTFLLDEPLANLDAKLRVQMRAELQQLHQELGVTTIYVTHDQEEAMTMSDRIGILNNGKLQQIDSPEVTYTQPNNEFVAGFIGSPSMNFFDCEVTNESIQTERFTIEIPESFNGTASRIGIRPEDIKLVDPGEAETTASVSVFEQLGSFNIVYIDLGSNETVVQVPGSDHYNVNDTVGIQINPERIHLFDDSGDAVYNPPLYSTQTVEM